MSLVHYKGETTRLGGVSGNGFMPGQSGNPGGSPKGLARRVRELVGDQGEAIAEFMFEVMNDESARRADRIDAGRWLADRGFGRAPVQTEIPVCEHPSIDLSGFSPEDLEAMLAILERHDPGAREQAASGRIHIDVGAASITGYRQP